jgi:hypothetical protein
MMKRLLAVCVLLTSVTLPAAAQRDIVHFGNPVILSEDQSTDDVVCFFCSVEAKSKVRGDIVVFFGNVKLDEHAGGDVIVFGGDVWLGGFASIAHDLVVFGGTLHADDGVTIGGGRVLFPPAIFLVILLPIVAIAWGIWLLLRWLFRGRQAYYPPPPPVRR